jgi:predicted nucleotidyltransferase
MDLAELRERLARLAPRLEELGVEELRVFGSTARGQRRIDSDLDLIVRFKGKTTADSFFGLLFLIEDELGLKVDLLEEETLHPLIRESALREAVRVA